MPLAEFGIGTDTGSLTNVESLTEPLTPPRSTWAESSSDAPLLSSGVRGGGWPVVTWSWGVMSQAQRDQLRTFVSGKSARVAIRTLDKDNSYLLYEDVLMIWPENEDRQAGRVLGLTVSFYLIEQAAFLLQENGDYLLQENGDKIIL